MGGAGLDSLVKHARGNFLGTYFRIAGPLYERLLRMGMGVNLVLAASIATPESEIEIEIDYNASALRPRAVLRARTEGAVAPCTI